MSSFCRVNIKHPEFVNFLDLRTSEFFIFEPFLFQMYVFEIQIFKSVFIYVSLKIIFVKKTCYS